jgi:WhiB family transcriptional regulator, redox-sensing transcriptional regulator
VWFPSLLAVGRLAVPPVTFAARSLGWMSRGACRQADSELFFPVVVAGTAARQAEAAKAVCGSCGVRASCLSYALEAMPEGVWGGTTQEGRRAALKRPVRRQASEQAVPRPGQRGDRGKRDARRARNRGARPARQDRVMSLPASQQPALNRIEEALAHDHPGLGPLFATFTRRSAKRQCP